MTPIRSITSAFYMLCRPYCLGVVVLFSGCGIYNSSFDCKPGKGVGCASVGKVLDMIVERDGGEDIFDPSKQAKSSAKQKSAKQANQNEPPQSGSQDELLQLVRNEEGELCLVKKSEEGSQ